MSKATMCHRIELYLKAYLMYYSTLNKTGAIDIWKALLIISPYVSVAERGWEIFDKIIRDKINIAYLI